MIKKEYNPAELVKRIQKRLKHFPVDEADTPYLDTGSKRFNSVFGDRDKGIMYGKMIELSGKESSGKSSLAFDLLALAQADGAYTALISAENSAERQWIETRGVDYDKLALFKPYMGRFGSEKKKLELASAEKICDEFEDWLKTVQEDKPGCKIFAVLDSVSALLPEVAGKKSIQDINMRTRMSLPQFLSDLLRRWVGLLQSCNCTMLFINQIRINPMKMFGNPEYTTGGEALKFYCHVRTKARRIDGGVLLQAGKQVGIKGTLSNVKNKAGGVEHLSSGYKIFFDGHSSFLDVEKLKKEKKVKNDE